MRNRLYCSALAAGLTLAALPAPAVGQGVTPLPAAADAPDATLWDAITRGRNAAPPPGLRDVARFTWEREQLQSVLQRVRSYQSLYPGGPRAEEAFALELQLMFDLAALGELPWTELERRARALRAGPPMPAVEHEAAYWLIIATRAMQQQAALAGRAGQSGGAASRPATTEPAREPDWRTVLKPDAALLSAYAEYCARYPTSRYVPRFAIQLLEDAAGRGELAEMRRWAAHLAEHFPGHAATRQAAGALRLVEAVGRPFWISFRRTMDDQLVDTRQMTGRPLLIVIWAGSNRSSRDLVREIEELRSGAGAGFQVVGVNLDPSTAECAAAMAELGIDWPQLNDGRGWATQFLLEWGIREAPFVLVLDSAGRLAGAGGADAWRGLLERLPGQ